MFKKENKSFTIEEVVLGLLIFMISLSVILPSYLTIIRSHLITNNQLIALQNLKTALDRIYVELKSGEVIATDTHSIIFKNIQDCATQTIIFSTSSNNEGYLSFIKDNSTITLTDTSLVNIKNMNFNFLGKIDTVASPQNIFNENVYYTESIKAVTLAIEAENLLSKGLAKPINIQLTIQPFGTFIATKICF